MDFGEALTALLAGKRVARSGWNGKGMFVVHQAGYPDGIAINANTAAATGIPQGTVCAFRPYLMMRTVDGEFVPWVASQTDLLAEDWDEVECLADHSGPAEEIARAFHETYERLAPSHGYETREASAKPWSEVPEQNRTLMVATVRDLIDNGVVKTG